MRLTSLHTGSLKLDGGAMFGIVPKKMWQKLNPPDENNLCTWAAKCLLVETEFRKILIDTGLGIKHTDTFKKHFEPSENQDIVQSLEKMGIEADQITDVFLTHLHFDHCGGATIYAEENKDSQSELTTRELIPTFPNAIYWSNQRHWDWAMNPNARESASFLKENFQPLQEKGVLKFIDIEENIEFTPNIRIHFTYGHTEAMMMVKLETQNKTLVYCADTLPSKWHIGLPYIMAYDIRPLESLKEKTALLEQAATEGWYLYFEHDPDTECGTVKKDEKGRIVLDKTYALSEIFI